MACLKLDDDADRDDIDRIDDDGGCEDAGDRFEALDIDDPVSAVKSRQDESSHACLEGRLTRIEEHLRTWLPADDLADR